jgi:FKBP-type peptidyl-prolyl cis-trans isomerase
MRDTLITINKYLLKEDEMHIKNYVERHGWQMQMTETGLWYEVYEKGTGEQALKGNIAKIKYTIELLDGTLCYSSDKDGPKEFKLGQGNVESGLEEGLLLMHCGDKAHFIMPPHIAHGLIGDSKKIPARAIIVYNVELTELKKLK